MDYRRLHDYKKHFHNEMYKITVKSIQHFAKISYYCYIIENLLLTKQKYIPFDVIDRLDRYDNYDDFLKIEYLDPYSSMPTIYQTINLKSKLVYLLKIFLTPENFHYSNTIK